MSYDYKTQKKFVFTEEGQIVFLKIRDHVFDLIKMAGCFRMDKVFSIPGVSGETWDMIACVDRLVEIGEIREIEIDALGQHRIFTTTKHNH